MIRVSRAGVPALLVCLSAAACGGPSVVSTAAPDDTELRISTGLDEVPSGTAVSQRFPGVTFHEAITNGPIYAAALDDGSGNVFAIRSPATYAGIYGNAFAADEGAVDAVFAAPQRTVSVEARGITALEYLFSTPQRLPYLEAYAADGRLIARAYYDASRWPWDAQQARLAMVSPWQTLSVSGATADIAWARFSSQANDSTANRAYGGIYGQFDNFRWDTGSTAAASGYEGCFADDANRTLPVRLIGSNATIESCVAAAQAKGYPYAGLQWYGSCWAGYALAGSKADESECNTRCSANTNEFCGGAWRNSIYATGAWPAVPPASSSLGCYEDGTTRALPALVIAGGATIETCTDAARRMGFAYAGLQWYGQCFAGDVLGSSARPASECSLSCSAAEGETCGGSYRNSVWVTQATKPPVPAPSTLERGCYTDDANRALPALLIRDGATPASCIASARAMGYAYAGLQWTGACYGGDVPGYSRVSDSECQATRCAADPSQFCGGAWRSRIFATQ